MTNAALPSALSRLFTAAGSVVFLGRNAARCCIVVDGDVVVVATVADGAVLATVVMVTADDDGANDVCDDVTRELGPAASAAAIPASRRLRINPAYNDQLPHLFAI